MDQMEPDQRPIDASAEDELLMGTAADDDSDAPVRLDENAHHDGYGQHDETGRSHDSGHSPAGMLEGGDVRAEQVTISQGGARDVEATTVSITQGGAARVRAEQMSLSQGGVAVARTEKLTVEDGGSAFAVLSDHATVNEGGNVFLVVAKEVSGDAARVIDWRAAAAFAVGLVIAWRLLRRIF